MAFYDGLLRKFSGGAYGAAASNVPSGQGQNYLANKAVESSSPPPAPAPVGGKFVATPTASELKGTPAKPVVDLAAQEAARAKAAKDALTQAAIANTQKAIGSLDTEFNTGVGNIDASYNSLMGKYDKEAAKAKGEYEEQGVTNTQNLLKNKQNALNSAAQGRRGLRATLAALGALSGDGSVLADRAVTTAANQDIGESTDTYTTNAQGLDKALNNFNEEDRDRRAEAETAKVNQRTALEGSIAGKRQDFLQKLAALFGEAGNNGEATRVLNEAGDLNNVIASKSAVAATPFTEKSAAFTPGDLEKYLAGAGDMTVAVEGGGLGGNKAPSIFAGRSLPGKKREDELALAA